MTGYRDTTFCVSPGCVNACGRQLTPAVREAAAAWWGGPDAPIVVGEFCRPTCDVCGSPVAPGTGQTTAETVVCGSCIEKAKGDHRE